MVWGRKKSEWERANSRENDPNYVYEYQYPNEGNEHQNDSHFNGEHTPNIDDDDAPPNQMPWTTSSTRTLMVHRQKFKYPPRSELNPNNNEGTKENQDNIVYYKRGMLGWISRKWDEIGDISAEEQSDIVEGRWDYWKAYYCYSQSTAVATEINELFLVWSLLYTIGRYIMPARFLPYLFTRMYGIGMNKHMDLIYLTYKNGGISFLLVCLVVYIGVGYPMYVLETMMGQYGGKKPLSMLRYMTPCLQGIGPVLWLRTFMNAVKSLVTALYSLDYFLDLYVCNINHNELLARFCDSGGNKKVNGTQLNMTIKLAIQDLRIGLEDELTGFLIGAGIREWMLVIFILTSILCVARLRSFGKIYALCFKLIYVAWFGYFLYSILRTYSGIGSNHSIMYFPLELVMRTSWAKVLSGKVWMDAVYFVFSSLGLATLVHPYFASRCFYHYRTARDGVYIILLTIIWNIIGALTVLLYLGYVTVNRKEMIRAVKQIGGPQGLFITYVMKHNQANQLDNLEYDTEFYCGLFYAIVAFMALCSFHACFRALIHSSFQEYTSLILASVVIAILIMLFSVGVPLVFLTHDGLRILTYMDFYLNHTFGVIFVGLCFVWSVGKSHNFVKIVYDIRNMVHLAVFEQIGASPAVRAHYPKFYCNVIILGFLLLIVHSAARRPYPIAGGVDYSGNPRVVGIVCSFIPLIFILFIGMLACWKQKSNRKAVLRPHRDWYKNWYHNIVCFAEPRRR